LLVGGWGLGRVWEVQKQQRCGTQQGGVDLSSPTFLGVGAETRLRGWDQDSLTFHQLGSDWTA